MVSNRLALAALALTCVGAAAVGGYVANRHNVTAVATTSAKMLTTAANPQPLASPAASAVDVPAPKAAEAPARISPTTPAVLSTPVTRRAGASAPARPVQRDSEPVASHDDSALSLERGVPGTAGTASTPGTGVAVVDTAATPRAEDHQVEAQRAPEFPAKDVKNYEELVVASDSVVGLQTDTALSSERARVEDRVEARVVRDVRVGGAVAIPAGTRALGSVVVVERGGRFKERARLGIRFQTLILADGTRLPITTETIYRYSNGPGNVAASRIGGGAVVGAIIGGIIGGGKGAAIGATTGAGAGTASVMSGDPGEATFPAGAEVTARILSPVTVTVEKD